MNYKLLENDGELSNAFYKEARDCIHNHPMFSSAKGVSVAAVAEYLANKNGYTFYEEMTRREFKQKS